MSVEVESAPVLTEKTTESKESPEAPVEAAKLLALGKRNLLCGEIPTAVNQLQEASSLLAASYGETAFECGESYFYYGQALLELARMETGVLGNALQGVPEEDTEDDAEPSEQFEKTENITGEELEKIRDDVYDAMSESDPQSQAKKEEESKTNGDVKTENEKSEDVAMETEQGNKENVEADAGEEETKEGEEGEGEGEEDGEEEGEGTAEEGEETDPGEGPSTGAKEEDPDDISNLQLSWEMLELAKVIYLKQEEQEMKLRAAQAFLKLGEVSLETEQYDQAISDISDCLKIQQEILAEDDRLLAETQYQLGLAFSFNKKFDEAVDSFRAAIKVIEERIGKLKKVVEDGKTTEKTEEKTAEKKEEKVEEKKEKVEEKNEKVEEKKEKVEEKKEENVEEKKAEEKTEKPEGDKTTDKTECEQKETKDIPVDPVKAAQKEIDELSEILPDIRSKIEDVAEERKNLDVLKTVAKEMCTSQMETETETIGTQPQTNENGAKASDISHLIRKKRKPESDIEEEAETKKSKQEDGSGDAAPKTNGVHEEETTKEATVKDVPMVTEDKAEAVST